MSDLESKTGLRVKGRLMSASEIERTLVRLAHEIVEKSNGSEDLALVGIKRRGVPLAERLGKLISTIEKRHVDTGVLDIQFYRDDLTTADVRPVVTPGAVGFDVEGRDIVICDDVLYTGRTVRAALDAHQGQIFAAVALFHDFVSQAHQSTLDLRGGHEPPLHSQSGLAFQVAHGGCSSAFSG